MFSLAPLNNVPTTYSMFNCSDRFAKVQSCPVDCFSAESIINHAQLAWIDENSACAVKQSILSSLPTSFSVFLCLPLLLVSFTVSCIVLAMPQALEIVPYHQCSRFVTMERRSSCVPIALLILITNHLISHMDFVSDSIAFPVLLSGSSFYIYHMIRP